MRNPSEDYIERPSDQPTTNQEMKLQLLKDEKQQGRRVDRRGFCLAEFFPSATPKSGQVLSTSNA